jgi:uncharacterized protein (TIGR03435 family)
VLRNYAVTFLVAACTGFAQTSGESPSFEVVSVKPASAPIATKDGYSAGYNAGMRAALASFGIRVVGKRVSVTDATLRDLIRLAYQVKDYQILGPPWLAGEKFEIAATLPDGATKEQAPAMLRTTLEQRFHLKLHREMRELPVYALVVDKKEAKLTPVAPAGNSAGHIDPGGENPSVRHVRLRGAVSSFADSLTPIAGKPVMDMTGIKGSYDFDLTYSPELNALGEDTGPSLANALRAQLGLRLETRKMKVEVLVIDSADRMPTEN